ncbi:tyrosine-type recombinase/integrase [Microvirga puerhi]|uniref:Tyrosine-type recombinase/integrase n=1 Tax=Microvirga puerhi TaxID=2876078 RepID=A0ABS7VPX3_9HYPH|nr:tyrosine-type recombinase/integrase [Microvirga puerhi]MBZ6077579.1 tyrosine-type recombinase/integrase [Microvirga puerhi]
MPTIRLTKRALDGIRPAEKVTFWFDADVKGFGLKVMPSGVMTWIVEYRPGAGGRSTAKKRVTLGKVGALTPEQARELARDILAKVHAGHDPANEKAQAKAAKTVAELCDLYLEEAEKGHLIGKRGTPKKASTLVSDRGRIARHIKPLLGKKLVREVTRGDIERFLRDVASGKTAVDVKTKKHGRAIVTGGNGTATRTVRLLGGIFSFAIQQGMRADNPTHGVAKYADRQGARFLNTEELDLLGAALRDAETVGLEWDVRLDRPGAKHLPKQAEHRRTVIGPHATAAIRLLILTGCRLGEILSLRWSHVDMERGFLFLPDSKTGAKTVVLGAPALEVLASVPRLDACPFVIAGEKLDRPRADLKRPWALVTRAAKLDGVRLHDLRHTYASHGAAGGMGLTIVGRLLGHADVKTTNRYSHFDADPLRRAANAIGQTLSAAMSEKSDRHDRNVIPISKTQT